LQVDSRPKHNGISDKVKTTHLADLCLITVILLLYTIMTCYGMRNCALTPLG
jgi:hypothetical protein